jgi:2-oxoglutarate ferredoxin oxidoreductase subunit alpha
MNKLVLMQGNEACVEGALRAGLRFYAGYPITPSTEIAELASIKLPQVGGKFIQMEDEISSMAAVIGASLCGLKSMTATSGPGFSLKQENIGYASMAEIPCVIVDVMRGGPSTGLPTEISQGDIMQSRWGTHGDHPVIVVAPSTVRDIYYLTIKAFNYSEKYRVPVILLLDEVNAHMRESVYIDSNVDIVNRKKPERKDNFLPFLNTEDRVPPMGSFGEGYKFHVTGLSHDEKGLPTNSSEVAGRLIRRLHEKIENNKENIVLFDIINENTCEDLIVAFGSVARVCREVINKYEDRKFGLFVPYTIWPFPERQLKEIVEKIKIKKIYVPELNTGQLIFEIERMTGCRCEVIGINKYCGELFTPDEIIENIRRR